MTRDEAFEMLEETELTGTQTKSYCVIDADTRKITVPDDYKVLGVESDENTERIWFKAAKVVGDGIDLTTLGIRINYQNANEQKDSYPVDDLAVEGDYVTFSWLLGRKPVAYKGQVRFIVCAVRTDSMGEISNEWNTTIASAEVLEGLEVDYSGIPDEEGKDLLEALIAQSQIKIQEVEIATQTARESAEFANISAGEAVSAATDANSAAEEARRAVEELKGGIGIDDNVVSENKTYSSKKIEEMAAVNWIPEYKLKSTQDLRSESKYENGKLTIFDTQPTENNHAYTRSTISVKPNTDYTISWKSERTGETGGGIWVNGTDNSVLDKEHINKLNGSFTFNTGEREEIFVLFIATVATQLGGVEGDSASFWDVMLVEGGNATPYIENVKDVVKEVAKANKRIETLEIDTDISEKTVTFEMASQRAGVESGDSLAVAFGKLAKYCVDLKDHAFANPVNNLLGTDSKLALAATQGKALDKKIEGVKSDVNELNGKFLYSGHCDPVRDGSTFSKNFRIIDLNNRYGIANQNAIFSFDTVDKPNWKNIPNAWVSINDTIIGYREVLYYGNAHVFIKVTEFCPVYGRMHFMFYNVGTWTNWKTITPV